MRGKTMVNREKEVVPLDFDETEDQNESKFNKSLNIALDITLKNRTE